MVFKRNRRAENRHDGVADELVEHAVVFENGVDHSRKILVQHFNDFVGTQGLG